MTSTGQLLWQETQAATFLHDYFATFLSCFGAQGLVLRLLCFHSDTVTIFIEAIVEKDE